MRLAIIGDPGRFEKDRCFLDSAKDVYKAVFYVPITELMIETGGKGGCKLLHRGKDITEFESILPIPTLANWDLFAAIIEVLANKKIYLPYTFETLSIMRWRALSLSVLRLAGFNVPELYYMISMNTMDTVLEKLSFPIDVLIESNIVVANDDKELRKLLKAKKGYGIYISEHVRGKKIECVVAGDIFVAAVEKNGKKMKSVSVGDDIKKIAVDAIKELGSVYGSVTFKGDKIVYVSLSPNFTMISSVSGRNVARELLEHLAKNIRPKQESVFGRILSAMKSRQKKGVF